MVDQWDLKGEECAAHPEPLIRAVLNALEVSPRFVCAYLDILGNPRGLNLRLRSPLL